MMDYVDINMSIYGRVRVSDLNTLLKIVEPHPATLDQAGAEAAPEPATKTRTTKAKAEEPAETGKGAEVEGKTAAGEAVDEVPSADDVAAAAKSLVAKNGREALVEMLDQYDAKQISGVPENKRAEFIEACEAAIS